MMEEPYIPPNTPISPTGSLLRGWRPSLVALFHQFRGSSDRDYLIKEDFGEIFTDSSELNKAFGELDVGNKGHVTLDEFMAGFSTFLQQNQKNRRERAETMDPSFFRKGSVRRSIRRRPIPEIFFETTGTPTNDQPKPTEFFKSSLKHLGTRTQENIEQLWCNLSNQNPDLIGDFEEFISELSAEVGSAQRALKKQREANSREAMQLDQEMERLHNDTQSKLELETLVIKEKAQSNQLKLQEKLSEKDEELTVVKEKLQMLESEIVTNRQHQNQLRQEYEEVNKEKDELLTKLERSEAMLDESQKIIYSLKEQASLNEERQKGVLMEQQAVITQIQSNYSKDVSELKNSVSDAIYQRDMLQQSQNRQSYNNNASYGHQDPNFLGNNELASSCSLMEEIMEHEGMASPVLRKSVIHPTGFQTSFTLSPTYANDTNIEHLDLAAELPSVSVGTVYNDVQLRHQHDSDRQRQRPVSLNVGYSADMDLNWPPSSWAVPTQEWLQSVAANTITGSNQLKTTGEVAITPIVNEMDDDFKIKKYSDPLSCKPLQFMESLVAKPDMTYKILIVGNPCVGKSCFLMRLCTNTFSKKYASTIGVDFYSRLLKISDYVVSLQLWDTAGQERFQCVSRSYYRGVHGAILMYDITNEDSFIAVRSWINSIQEHIDAMPQSMILVGNKVDLDLAGKRQVLIETGETFAKIYGAQFIETSAKSGYNVSKACHTLINNLITLHESTAVSATNSAISLAASSVKSKSSCSC